MAEETGTSLLDRLKAEHAALGEKRTVDRPLPGYSRLVGRFKAVGREVITDLKERAQRVAEGDEIAAGRAFDADLLINTCEGIYERREDGELIALTEAEGAPERWGDEPIVFDERLAEAVGAELPDDPSERTARAVVFAVLEVDKPDTGNDVRFAQFAGGIWRWIHSGHDQADEDF